MFNIYATNSYKEGSKYIMGQLAKTNPKMLRIKHIVLVPDRASYSAESDMLRNLGGSMNVQVLTIRRFANMVLPKFNYLSKQAGIMALTGIIADNKEKLTCFTKGVDSSGFVENMYEVISQLKYSRIKADKLVKNDLPVQLVGKINDIRLLYGAYEEFLTSREYVDSATKLEKLIEAISVDESIKNSYFYVYDFDNMSKQEVAIITQLVINALGVTVACCYSDKPQHKFLYLNEVYDSMVEIAENLHVQPNIMKKCYFENNLSKQIGEYMYGYYKYKPMPIDKDKLEIFEAMDGEEEVIALAQKIARWVRDGGRYSDFYVICSEPKDYRLSVERIFSDYNIPYFMDTQISLVDHALTQYLMDFLTASRNNFAIDNVLSVVKNYFFDGNGEDIFAFENFCLKYNVSYNYEAFDLGGSDVDYDSADRVRAILQQKIDKYPFESTNSVDSYVLKVRDFLEGEQLQTKLSTFSALQTAVELDKLSKSTDQVYDKILETLTVMSDVLGDKAVTFDNFIKILRKGLEGVSISVLPVHNDCVVITNMGKSRKHDITCLALLGANQTRMPIIKKDTKLLSDKNIADLAKYGIDLQPQMQLENKRERFSLFQTLLEPTKLLYLSFPTTASDGEGNIQPQLPSDFVLQLINLFGDGGGYQVNRVVEQDKIFTDKVALKSVVANRRRLVDSQPVNSKYFSKLLITYDKQVKEYLFDKTNVDNLDCGKELFFTKQATSVTKIEDFYKCPYQHYLQYGLGLKQRQIAELKAVDFGNILHEVLEYFVKEVELNESKQKSVERSTKIFNKVMQQDYYRGISKDVKYKNVLKQLAEEAKVMCGIIKEQLIESKFSNFDTELGFGGKNKLAPIVIDCDGEEIFLKGIIDRVDTKDDKFVIIDYKSGTPEYNEKLLYMGLKLQLLVYLRAIESNLGRRPVGYYYMKLHNDFVSDDKAAKAYTLIGRSLNDLDTLKEIDTTLVNNKSSTRLGIKLKNDGQPCSSPNLLTSEQIDAQVDYAMDAIRQAGILMQRGFIKVSPVAAINNVDVCDYCDVKDICFYNDLYLCDRRNCGKVNPDTIVEVNKTATVEQNKDTAENNTASVDKTEAALKGSEVNND